MDKRIIRVKSVKELRRVLPRLTDADKNVIITDLVGEILNLVQITSVPKLKPIPKLGGMDIHWGSFPYHGAAIGGDLIFGIDFKNDYDLDERIRRAKTNPRLSDIEISEGVTYRQDVINKLELNKERVGICIIDVAGHDITDSVIAYAVKKDFEIALKRDLATYGEVTAHFLESLNSVYYGIGKMIALSYIEISGGGVCRYVRAGNPGPLGYSKEMGRFFEIPEEQNASSIPLGVQISDNDPDFVNKPNVDGSKKAYKINQLVLKGVGDLLIFGTDGFYDHSKNRGKDRYYKQRLEPLLREVKDLSAEGIFNAIAADMFGFSRKKLDDITFAVIKKAA